MYCCHGDLPEEVILLVVLMRDLEVWQSVQLLYQQLHPPGVPLGCYIIYNNNKVNSQIKHDGIIIIWML